MFYNYLRTLVSFLAIVGILSEGFTDLCNIDNCYNVTNLDLADQYQYFDPVTDSKQTYTRLVSFRGSTSNCSVTFASNTSNGATKLEIKWLISRNSIDITSLLTGVVNGAEFPVDITDRFKIKGNFKDTEQFETQLIPKTNETFLKVLIYDQGNNGIIREKTMNYAQKLNAATRNLAQRMVRGLPVNNNTVIRSLKTEHCEGDLTIRLCPCVEPAVSLKRQGTNLTCQGGSIDEIIELLWFKDNQVLVSGTEEQNENRQERLKLHQSSTLTNITETNRSIFYTCKVTTGRNKTTKRNIMIPAFDLPYSASAEGGVGDNKNINSQEHIAYIIFFVVCAVLVTLVISTCVVLWLTNKRKLEQEETRTLEQATSPVFQGEIPLPPDCENHETLLLYQSLDDLLQLLDSVAYPRTPGVPGNNGTTLGNRDEAEPIYDRLDTRLMTVNRGGRIEGIYRMGYV